MITRIINCSLRQHTVPFMWKLANISPLPKESPFTECNQLRPIFVRIFERLVCKQELSYSLKSAIRPGQFAYEEGLNTTMALIACQHHWLDKDEDFIRVFSFDFSKAFDSVSHQILCNKLKSCDINPYTLICTFINFRSTPLIYGG